MTKPIFRMMAAAKKYFTDQRGVSAVIMALSIVPIAGLMGLAIDISHVVLVKQELQASTDAAALAGADQINDGGDAIGTANSYSGVGSGKNPVPAQTVSMVSGYPQLQDFKSTGAPCVVIGGNCVNGIVVKQQTTVNMFFAQVMGIQPVTVTTTSVAGASGGKPIPLNVMLVLDTTASMNTADANCSVAGATRLACALAGARVLLNEFSPSIDQVGLTVFPGVQKGTESKDYDCSSSTPTIVAYNNKNLNYLIVPGSMDYKLNDNSKTLSTSSNIVKAVQGNSSCSQGLSAVGGVGTFYADAINQAQVQLAATHQTGMQNVIIFLSDGDANAKSGNMPLGEASNQCHEAITAAANAAAAGTWVYSIAYGSPTQQTPASCSTDTSKGSAISACSTMQKIASDPQKFYSDNTSALSSCTAAANSINDLVSIFTHIAQTLLAPRLLPDNTT